MARTSSGKPDQAESRSSVKDMELACSMRLNLLMRLIRAECSSTSFGEALSGTGGWLIRCKELAGSRRISLYCGLRIFPSALFAEGYEGKSLSSAMSPLSLRVHEGVKAGVRVDIVGTLEDESDLALAFCFWPLLRMLAILGKPNSSSSSSKAKASWSGRSAGAHSLLVLPKKVDKPLRGGEA